MTLKTIRFLLYINIGLLTIAVIASIMRKDILSATCNLIWILCCINFAEGIYKSEQINHINDVLSGFFLKITKHTDQGETVAIKQEADGKLHIYPAKEVGVDPAQEGGHQ